ncbi:MAG: hypothetical protein KIS73_09410 [Enhydrobacter sp.]|nr:hypothetical protein [Enhydrobacter sp.]
MSAYSARGEFIVDKSSDTFYSQEVIEKNAVRDLRTDTIYRVDRHVAFIDDPSMWDLPDEVLPEKFATLPGNIHGGIHQVPEWGLREFHTNACGDFTLMAAHHWKTLHGYPRDPTCSRSIAIHWCCTPPRRSVPPSAAGPNRAASTSRLIRT